MMTRRALATALVLLASSTRADDGPKTAPAAPVSTTHFPLAKIADVPLPGGATRFDYQELDVARGHLVVAHMNDASVLVLKLADGSVVKELRGIPVPRGIAVGEDVGRIFVTSSPSTLVIIDAKSLNESARVPTGRGPDGVAYDAVDHVVATSDQRDGGMSLIADSGQGKRQQVLLGRETGNVVFDPARRVFWIAVETSTPPDQLVSVDPKTGNVLLRIGLQGRTRRAIASGRIARVRRLRGQRPRRRRRAGRSSLDDLRSDGQRSGRPERRSGARIPVRRGRERSPHGARRHASRARRARPRERRFERPFRGGGSGDTSRILSAGCWLRRKARASDLAAAPVNPLAAKRCGSDLHRLFARIPPSVRIASPDLAGTLLPMSWYQDFFRGGPWSKIQSGGYPPERTSAECDLIQGALGLAPGARVLDIPCGIGRHSVELARRGFRMTGVDFGEEFVTEARSAASDAGVNADFLVGDMREFTTREPFDAAFCFFGSFGYFSESDDEKFARAVVSSLRAGGRFAVDAHITETLLPVFQERAWHWTGEPGASARVLEERRWDPEAGRAEVCWTVVDAGAPEHRDVDPYLLVSRAPRSLSSRGISERPYRRRDDRRRVSPGGAARPRRRAKGRLKPSGRCGVALRELDAAMQLELAPH